MLKTCQMLKRHKTLFSSGKYEACWEKIDAKACKYMYSNEIDKNSFLRQFLKGNERHES